MDLSEVKQFESRENPFHKIARLIADDIPGRPIYQCRNQWYFKEGTKEYACAMGKLFIALGFEITHQIPASKAAAKLGISRDQFDEIAKKVIALNDGHGCTFNVIAHRIKMSGKYMVHHLRAPVPKYAKEPYDFEVLDKEMEKAIDTALKIKSPAKWVAPKMVQDEVVLTL